MFALWPFNSERSLMILVSGSIADFSWTLVAVRHHVLPGSRSGQTHSLPYIHIHTPAPPVPLIPEHATRQTWDLVILPTSQAWAQHSGSCCSDLPWLNLKTPSPLFLLPVSIQAVIVVPLEEMALPCGQNVEVIHFDLFYGLLCGFLRADVGQGWLRSDSHLLHQILKSGGNGTSWKWIRFLNQT